MPNIESEIKPDHEFSVKEAKRALRAAGVRTKTRLSLYDDDNGGPITGRGPLIHVVYLARDSRVGTGWHEFSKGAFISLGRSYAQQPVVEPR